MCLVKVSSASLRKCGRLLYSRNFGIASQISDFFSFNWRSLHFFEQAGQGIQLCLSQACCSAVDFIIEPRVHRIKEVQAGFCKADAHGAAVRRVWRAAHKLLADQSFHQQGTGCYRHLHVSGQRFEGNACVPFFLHELQLCHDCSLAVSQLHGICLSGTAEIAEAFAAQRIQNV